jgi:hypothetical protein
MIVRREDHRYRQICVAGCFAREQGRMTPVLDAGPANKQITFTITGGSASAVVADPVTETDADVEAALPSSLLAYYSPLLRPSTNRGHDGPTSAAAKLTPSNPANV